MRVGEIRMFKAVSAVGSPWGSASSWVGFIVLVLSGYWKYEALSSSYGDGIAIGYYKSNNGFGGWKYSPSLSSGAVSWNGGAPFELTIKNFNVNGVNGGLITPSSWTDSYPLNIWAPTNAGAEGQVLTSSGAGLTPVWKDLTDIPAAESAKKLSNPRLIWGQSFDGTANVDGAFTMNLNSGSSALSLNIPSNANVINVNSSNYTIAANSTHSVNVRGISSTFSRGWRYLDTKAPSAGSYVFGVYGNAGTVDYYFYGGDYSSPLLKINRATSSPRAELSGIMQASGFKTPSGDSSQFLKADGSVDSNTYITIGTIYAPTSAGNAGQVLTSSGAGLTPVWKDLTDIPAAESAKKLSNPRLIWGQSFDGTANVDGAFTMNLNSGSSALSLNIPSNANVINVNSSNYTIAANSTHSVNVRGISSTFSRGWRYLDTKAPSAGSYVFGVYGNAGTVDYYFYGGDYSSPLLKINRATSSPRAELSGIMQASGFKTPSGDSSQFLKADGSVDSNTYITNSNLTSSLGNYVTTKTTINKKEIGNGVNLVPSDLGIQQKNININGSSKTVYAPNTEVIGTIYAPTSAGNAGQVLKSNGSGSPVWANFSEAEYGKEATFYIETNNGGTIYVPGRKPELLPEQGSSGPVLFYDRAPVFISFNSRSQCRNLKLSLLLGSSSDKFVLYQMSHKNVTGLNNGVMVQYDYTHSLGTTYPSLAGIIFYPSDECTYSLEYNPT